MGLKYWWILFIWAFAAMVYGIIFYLRRKNRRITEVKDKVPIAHSDRLTKLPEYKTALRRYERLVSLAAISLTVTLLVAIFISARPVAIATITPAQKGRDIMLCLDVSGSLLRVDAILVNRFTTLINSFSGQRVGLTVFNSSSISVLPLSDDYGFLTSQLVIVGQALTQQEGDEFDRLTSGTLANFDKGTSLVSDGVTSCINNLGSNPLKRSQSVILATDNESNGTPIISPDQALALANKKNIRIYAIDPGEGDGSRKADHEQLKKIAEDTAGSYHTLDSQDTIPAIIDGISQQEARYAASQPVVAVSDKPSIFAYILIVAALISFTVVWRLRL